MSTNRRNVPATLDIVIPIYNEEETLGILFERLNQVFCPSNLQKHSIESVNYLFIDDGSSDSSPQIISDFISEGFPATLYRFSRNFGHQNAVTAGLDHSQADMVAVMDADLQDPPEVILQMVTEWRKGFDVVYAIRKARKENVFKRTAYKLFYKLLRRISYLQLPLDSGDFSLIDKTIVRILCSLPERNRFVRGLRTWVGFEQVGVEYDRNGRCAGVPKYDLRKLLNLAYDGLVSFSYAPLRFATNFGFVTSLFAFMGIIVVIVLKLFSSINVSGWASLTTIILFMGGVQLITIGVIGEYIGKILDEVKQRPKYVIRQKIGLDDHG